MSAKFGRMLWLFYFGVMALAAVIGMLLFAILAVLEPPPSLTLALGSTALSLSGLVGLWGFVRHRRIGARWFWIAIFVATAVQMLTGLLFCLKLLATFGHSGSEGTVTLLLLLGILFALPWTYALGKYACGSPELWEAFPGSVDQRSL